MTTLTLLGESTVQDEEIDSLGHMNVRFFYVQRMDAANRLLLERVGFAADPAKGELLRRVDTYNRFHREQFAGARLDTLGGLLEADSEGGVRAYFEIRNHETGDLASSFVVTSHIVDVATQTPIDRRLADDALAESLVVDLPEAGRPRSLALTAPPAVDLDRLEALIPEADGGMMTGRREGTIPEEYCDESGRVLENMPLMFMLHRPDSDQPHGPPVARDADGIRYSWAIMETRSIAHTRPSAGDVIVSLGANIAHGEKWRHSRRWTFDKATRELLAVDDHVALCMDLDARRAIRIPAAEREAIEQGGLGELV